MFGLFRRERRPVKTFDREKKTPVIRASICTGEQVAGFKDRATGRFEEVMLIRTEADRQEFLRTYGIQDSELQREW